MKHILTILFLIAVCTTAAAQCTYPSVVTTGEEIAFNTSQYPNCVQGCTYDVGESRCLPTGNWFLWVFKTDSAQSQDLHVMVSKSGDTVYVDTCITLTGSPASSVPHEIKYTSNDPDIAFTVSGFSGQSAWVYMKAEPYTFPNFHTKYIISEQCTATSMEPKQVDTIFTARFDITGKPCSADGLYIEVIQLMDGSFTTRKKYKLQ